MEESDREDSEDLNKEIEGENNKDEIREATESENEETLMKKQIGQKNKKKKETTTAKGKRTRKIKGEEDMKSNEQDGGSNSENEMLSEAKKRSKDGAEEDIKPRNKVTYPTCNTRSSPIFDAMSCLTNERKRCLKQIGFERYINFPIVELPSTLAYHVIDNLHTSSMELRLQKGSVKATRQKVHDIFGIPIGNTKLQDLEQRDANDPFIAEWEAQYSHLKKPTPPEIALQISSTTKEDFMFKMYLITLFGSTMGTLENGGRERSELVRTLKDGVTKFEKNQMMIEFCKQYGELFNDNEFNVSESSMDDYRDGDSDAYDNNKKNDDEKETMADGNKKSENENEKKESKDENGTGTKEGRAEAKDDGDDNIKDKDGSETKGDGYEVKDNVNNENDFENMLGDDKEDEDLMDIDIPNEEMKQKEADKEKVSHKNGNESEKEKQYEANKVEKVQEIQEEHNRLTEDQFWDLTDKQCEELEIQTAKDIKKNQTTKRKSIIDMTPPSFSLGLSPTENEPKSKNKEERTKDMFKWKKENGEYDEEKQFEAFSKTIQSEFKKDPEMKNMKDLEMKKLFSMHLEKVEHPRAKDILKKKSTIIRPKWGTKENDTDCGIFLMMHMEHYNREATKNWNLEFPTEEKGNTLDIIRMREGVRGMPENPFGVALSLVVT
nr:hypothetical protein [Tanacetum cinerariifolium]